MSLTEKGKVKNVVWYQKKDKTDGYRENKEGKHQVKL